MKVNVIQAKDSTEISDSINALLKNGWEREGGIIITPINSDRYYVQYTQVMIHKGL